LDIYEKDRLQGSGSRHTPQHWPRPWHFLAPNSEAMPAIAISIPVDTPEDVNMRNDFNLTLEVSKRL
jgi:hypothetical protein